MSRIGKKPITIPKGVTVSITDHLVQVSGAKGKLQATVRPEITLEQQDDSLTITVADAENKKQRAYWGLTRALIQNMIVGVSTGYSKSLELNGVGYKVALQGKKLVLSLGYSHPMEFPLPAGIEASVEKNTVTLTGADKQQLGQVAAEIRSLRAPEPYKGKGIKYVDEQIRRKAGKVVKGSGA